MQARVTERPEHEVIAAIQALDLESVKLRVMDPELGEGWSREYADSIEAAYKTYLTMLIKYQDDAEDILLSEDVDEFWHTHILQTRKYAEDCGKAFGNFLHHEPHVGEVTSSDHEHRTAKAEKTRMLYEREFGTGERANAAWSGFEIRAKFAAYSNANIAARTAAYSNASIQAGGAAYSNASVLADKAAYSNASIKAHNAAYSNANIRASNAAYSNASIRVNNAAYSNAAIRAAGAAYSNASIRAYSAAYSNASIRRDNAAYSNASIATRDTHGRQLSAVPSLV